MPTHNDKVTSPRSYYGQYVTLAAVFMLTNSTIVQLGRGEDMSCNKTALVSVCLVSAVLVKKNSVSFLFW